MPKKQREPDFFTPQLSHLEKIIEKFITPDAS
jgi:hypothetical protein